MAWLTGFDKRIKITIDKDQIDEDLTNFPVPIYLSTSSGQENDDVSAIFDELITVSGTKKIAVTTSDEETQCYVEIERWDWSNEKAWLHVKIPTIVSGTDTELYFYYDSTHADNTTYVGDVGDDSAKNVWDSDFKAVYHLGEDPTIEVNTTYLNEDMADITDWTNIDSGNGVTTQETFDSKSCMKLTVTSPAGTAHVSRDVGTFGNRAVVELSIYCDLIGVNADTDSASFDIRTTDVMLSVDFSSDGLFIHDGAVKNEVGTSLVVQDTWQKWVFDIDWATPASATVDVYLDDELVALGVDCSRTGVWTNGEVHLLQRGGTTSNTLSYVDYLKIGDEFTNNIKDSTYNINHGVSNGSMTSGDLVDGKFGKALDFDGSDDYINCGSDSSLDDITTKTIEAVIYLDTYGESSMARVIQKSNVNLGGWHIFVRGTVSTNWVVFAQDWNSGTFAQWATPIDSILTETWYTTTVTYDNSLTTNDPVIYINGISQTIDEANPPTGSCDSDASNDLWIGARSNSGPDRSFDGVIDEVRISDTIRSFAWISATYESLWDNLLTFGIQTSPPVFYYEGYITVESEPGARVINLYKRDTGELVNSTTSSGSSGYFKLGSQYDDYHFVVALPDLTENYAILTDDKIHPSGGN